ncbi:MAG: hypothetical protein ORN57_03345, partial [Alphaproteobacteria bacterium]|nr:hypothetical protein [Alphaproteobacteria bacterium]
MTFFSTLASDALKHNGRAIAMAEMASFEREKNWQGAADSCQQLLHRYGDDFFLWDHFVFQQFQLQQQGRALVGLAKLLALKKNYSRGQLYRASALSRVGRFDEAIENLTDILCRDDADKKNLCETAINLAMNYHIVGNSEKSLEAIAMAAQFRDEYGGSEQDVQKRQAFCWLHAGDYKKGFAAYEYRHDQQDPNYFQQLPHHKPENRWQGEAITDDILLVAMEQGLGDMIWHARFLPLLQHKCKKIIVACYQELYRLFRSSPMAAGIEVVLSTNRPPPFDKWVRMMSLPHLLGVDQHNVPQQLPYLWPPVDAAKLPNNYFTQDDNLLRIGLVWQSGDRGLDRANRSCALTDIATLLEVPGCRFYSFQYESDEHKIKNEIESLGLGAYIDDTRPLIKDMADTASLLQAMDLLITVDTAVAHLMGALRRPVWVLLPFETSWKWHRGAQSIWYPEVMTLFRQRAVGDWLIPIAEIKTELNNIVAAINQRRTAR